MTIGFAMPVVHWSPHPPGFVEVADAAATLDLVKETLV